jgi:hypothetical protein
MRNGRDRKPTETGRDHFVKTGPTRTGPRPAMGRTFAAAACGIRRRPSALRLSCSGNIREKTASSPYLPRRRGHFSTKRRQEQSPSLIPSYVPGRRGPGPYQAVDAGTAGRQYLVAARSKCPCKSQHQVISRCCAMRCPSPEARLPHLYTRFHWSGKRIKNSARFIHTLLKQYVSQLPTPPRNICSRPLEEVRAAPDRVRECRGTGPDTHPSLHSPTCSGSLFADYRDTWKKKAS